MDIKIFKDELINDIIPRIENLRERERKHLYKLIGNKAPIDFIQLSQKYYNHFEEQIIKYKEYANRL